MKKQNQTYQNCKYGKCDIIWFCDIKSEPTDCVLCNLWKPKMENKKEITKSNMIDTVYDAIDDLSNSGLLDLYNQLTNSDYRYEDVEWDN